MSAIVTFKLLPTNKLIGLREVWPNNFDYLEEHAERWFDRYNWSGYCVAALMLYLKKEKQIDFAESDYNKLFPDAEHNGTWFLDKHMKDKYLKQLSPSNFSKTELKDALEEWFFGRGPDSAEPMLDALKLLKQSLEMVDEHNIMLVHVG